MKLKIKKDGVSTHNIKIKVKEESVKVKYLKDVERGNYFIVKDKEDNRIYLKLMSKIGSDISYGACLCCGVTVSFSGNEQVKELQNFKLTFDN